MYYKQKIMHFSFKKTLEYAKITNKNTAVKGISLKTAVFLSTFYQQKKRAATT